MKILVGIPAYDGTLCVETVQSLLNERLAAHALGIDLDVQFLPRTSLITQARNQMVQTFLEGEWDRFFFLDSDVAFNVGDLLKLAHLGVDFVGGAYRKKEFAETYPVTLPGGQNWASELGLLEAEKLPAGFLCLSRKVFDTLKAAHPRRAYMLEGKVYHGFFHAPIEDGVIWGEDSAFCADWRATGGKIWLDPELTLTHVGGGVPYTGCIGRWLQARPPAPTLESSIAEFVQRPDVAPVIPGFVAHAETALMNRRQRRAAKAA